MQRRVLAAPAAGGREPRGRDPRRSVDRWPGAVRRHQHRRHLRAAGGSPCHCSRALPEAERAAFRFLHVSTDEVYGSLGDDGLFTRGHALRTELALRRQQGVGRSPGARLLPHLRPADADHELLEQLRTLPVSREADSADDPERARWTARCRSTATAATCATGSTSRTTVPACCTALQRGVPGEKYNIGGDNERTNLQVVDVLCDALESLRAGRHQPGAAGARQLYRAAARSCPTVPGTTAAMPSMPRRSQANSGGSRPTTSSRGCGQPSRGIVNNRDWCEAVQSGRYERERLGLSYDEGHHSRRRLRHTAASADARGQQAAAADLQQADGLLPAVHADAGGHPGCAGHHHAARPGRLPASARRRLVDSACGSSMRRSPTRTDWRRRSSSAATSSAPTVWPWRSATTSSTARTSPTTCARRRRASTAPTVFGYRVRDPERYGVVEFDADGHAVEPRGEAGEAEVERTR